MFSDCWLLDKTAFSMAFPLPAPSKYFIVKTNVLKQRPSQTNTAFWRAWGNI